MRGSGGGGGSDGSGELHCRENFSYERTTSPSATSTRTNRARVGASGLATSSRVAESVPGSRGAVPPLAVLLNESSSLKELSIRTCELVPRAGEYRIPTRGHGNAIRSCSCEIRGE